MEEDAIQRVWNKGRAIVSYDPNVWRKDDCGAWINRNHYGNRDSKYGWEIDHIKPNEDDTLSNLRPLQWENNLAKSDGKSVCVVSG